MQHAGPATHPTGTGVWMPPPPLPPRGCGSAASCLFELVGVVLLGQCQRGGHGLHVHRLAQPALADPEGKQRGWWGGVRTGQQQQQQQGAAAAGVSECSGPVESGVGVGGRKGAGPGRARLCVGCMYDLSIHAH